MKNITITNSKEFIDALSLLTADKNFPRENTTTLGFIEAMQAWLRDVEGDNAWFDDPHDDYITWADLYKLLEASGIYE